VEIPHDNLFLFKKPGQEVIHETLVRAGKYQRDFGGEIMQTFSADFRLTFQSGEIILIELQVGLVMTKNQKPLDYLSKQVLVMERNISPPIL
jgi:hypothetical protein